MASRAAEGSLAPVRSKVGIYYFAYGANLSRKVMGERCPGCKPRFTALLHNHKLVFTGWSRQWRGGVATIRPFKGERVPGGVYELTEADLRKLDKFEGYPHDYDRVKVRVNNEYGELIEAVTYVKRGQIEETAPSPDYLALIRQGYHDWEIE